MTGDCSCQVRSALHTAGRCCALVGKYVVRLDIWDDETVFDPACPFHGDEGTMVVVLHPTSRLR